MATDSAFGFSPEASRLLIELLKAACSDLEENSAALRREHPVQTQQTTIPHSSLRVQDSEPAAQDRSDCYSQTRSTCNIEAKFVFLTLA